LRDVEAKGRSRGTKPREGNRDLIDRTSGADVVDIGL